MLIFKNNIVFQENSNQITKETIKREGKIYYFLKISHEEVHS